MERGRIQGDCPNFLDTPYYHRNGKATDFVAGHFVATYRGSIGTKAHEKCWE